MNRDITALPTDLSKNCITILDSNTLQSHTSTDQDTYRLISNTYIHSTHDNVSGAPIPSGSLCLTQTQVSNLASNFDYIVPIYWTIAIVSSLMIFYLSYFIIIKPFYRAKA
jgi:hypothetical protein